MRARRRPMVWTLVTALVCTAFGVAAARAEAPLGVRAAVKPPTAQLGERVTYTGRVTLHAGAGPTEIRWLEPEADERLVWGPVRPRYAQGVGTGRTGDAARGPAPAAVDTAYVTTTLQVFDTGLVAIPGLRFEIKEGSRWVRYRLPIVQLPIVPVLTAADSNARLRPLHGPLGAPWWERVPWRLVIAIVLALLVAYLVWLRLRRRRPAAAPVPVVAPVTIDPSTEALRELAALRRLRLPQEGRFADHALALTRILRRFLERTRMTPRPGDTTPELVRRLTEAGLGSQDVRRIEDLLRYWDRLKFARAATALEEAEVAERAVETFLRASARATHGEAA